MKPIAKIVEGSSGQTTQIKVVLIATDRFVSFAWLSLLIMVVDVRNVKIQD
jgi:hypothetical protein